MRTTKHTKTTKKMIFVNAVPCVVLFFVSFVCFVVHGRGCRADYFVVACFSSYAIAWSKYCGARTPSNLTPLMNSVGVDLTPS